MALSACFDPIVRCFVDTAEPHQHPFSAMNMDAQQKATGQLAALQTANSILIQHEKRSGTPMGGLARWVWWACASSCSVQPVLTTRPIALAMVPITGAGHKLLL